MSRIVWILLTSMAVGCGDSGQGEDAGSESGETDTRETLSDESDESGETGLDGLELFGLVTVTHYPEDAAGYPELTELAGGLRSEPFEALEDLVSVVHLQTTFAPPAGAEDEVVVGPAATPWPFGPASTWLLAGDGLTLRALEEAGSIHGCRRGIGNFEDFPVYVTGGEEVPEACRAAGQNFMSAGAYELIVYGGELFADEVAPERLVAPESFVVSTPDLDTLDVAVARNEALELTWTSPSEPEAEDESGDQRVRFVIRLWDEEGTTATVVAADDGALSLSSAVLEQFAAGPATLTMTRETLSSVTLAAAGGVVEVVMREEHWGYLELY